MAGESVSVGRRFDIGTGHGGGRVGQRADGGNFGGGFDDFAGFFRGDAQEVGIEHEPEAINQRQQRT